MTKGSLTFGKYSEECTILFDDFPDISCENVKWSFYQGNEYIGYFEHIFFWHLKTSSFETQFCASHIIHEKSEYEVIPNFYWQIKTTLNIGKMVYFRRKYQLTDFI